MRRRSRGLLALVIACATGVGAAIAGAATTASAADLPAPGPGPASAPGYYPPAFQPALYNWTALYFGGQVGLAVLEDTVTTTTTTSLQNAGTQTHLSDTNLVGGAQIGADYQIASWLIGVEGAWIASRVSASHITASVTAGSERSTTDTRWYATATGRIGYAFDTVLLYAKGGGAWMREDYQQAVLAGNGAVNSIQSIGASRIGFVAGGGLEYGMTEHLSAKLEYEFFGFGTKGYTFSALVLPGGDVGLPISVASYMHVITLGLNFRFN